MVPSSFQKPVDMPFLNCFVCIFACIIGRHRCDLFNCRECCHDCRSSVPCVSGALFSYALENPPTNLWSCATIGAKILAEIFARSLETTFAKTFWTMIYLTSLRQTSCGYDFDSVKDILKTTLTCRRETPATSFENVLRKLPNYETWRWHENLHAILLENCVSMLCDVTCQGGSL